MSTTEIDSPRYDLGSFKIRRPEADPRPTLVWDETADIAFAVNEPTGGGEEDVTIVIRLNVDHGMWDSVYAEAGGHDQTQALDRAIDALTEIRSAIATMAGSTDGWCLTRNAPGARCTLRGAHDDHTFPPRESPVGP